MPEALPPEIVARFRQQAKSDLSELETSWLALNERRDPALGLEMLRRTHRLKGDARVVGAEDVTLACQRLEDLLGLAHRLSYQIPEELDLVVAMALRMIALLVEPGAPSSLDLAGFMRETEAMLVAQPAEPLLGDDGGVDAAKSGDTRLPARARQRLLEIALEIYLEHLRASGPARQRLRRTWSSLTALVQEDAVHLGRRLSHHAAATRALARQLGKTVHLSLQLGEVTVPSHVAELVNTALLHLCANAVDHGLEPPEERVAAGKPRVGHVRVHADEGAGGLALLVEDDGRGIDFAAVQTRARACGLIPAGAEPSDAELTYLLFYPRFSMRDEASTISGRGIGLHAVHDLVSGEGGRVELSAERGRGTTVALTLPLPPRRLAVRAFAGPVPFCVPDEYTVEVAPAREGAVDPLAALGLAPAGELVVRVVGPDGAADWRVAAPPRAAVCERMCVGESRALEVVLIEGEESLLMRPLG